MIFVQSDSIHRLLMDFIPFFDLRRFNKARQTEFCAISLVGLKFFVFGRRTDILQAWIGPCLSIYASFG